MSIHSIRPAPATGLTRRDALRMAVAGGVALGTAGALPAFAATAALKGNLKHSVARWTFPQLSVAQLCTTVKDIGFAAIDLAGIVSHVTLLEFDSSLRADEVLQKKLRSLGNVTVLTSAQTTEVLGDGSKVTGLVYKDRIGGDAHRVELEGIFVQIGLLPNTEWLKDVVALSPRGEIVIDDRGQTNLPGVFAAGDCTTVPYKQIIIAMGAGSTAALSAFDHLIRSSVSNSSGAVAEAA